MLAVFTVVMGNGASACTVHVLYIQYIARMYSVRRIYKSEKMRVRRYDEHPTNGPLHGVGNSPWTEDAGDDRIMHR
jgi:hypothetical protein